MHTEMLIFRRALGKKCFGLTFLFDDFIIIRYKKQHVSGTLEERKTKRIMDVTVTGLSAKRLFCRSRFVAKEGKISSLFNLRCERGFKSFLRLYCCMFVLT